MANNLDHIKTHLREYVDVVTFRSKGGLYICPLCGSGTGSHKTGAFSIQPDGLRWKCFVCNKGGDIFDLYEQINSCDKHESARALLEKYGNASIDSKYEAPQPKAETPPPNFSADIARFHAALAGSNGESYLQGRGITSETMDRFKLGYDSYRDCVTIPYNTRGTYYGRRNLSPNAREPHTNLRGVEMPLFNEEALYASDVCFVVESPLCAISIAQAGHQAIAISGNGVKRLVRKIEQKPTTATLALCFDADATGKGFTSEAMESLKPKGIHLCDVSASIMDGEKDPNECLQKRGAESFARALNSVVEEIRTSRTAIRQEEDAERQQRTGAGMVDSFLQAIQSRRYEPVPTGIVDIDKALGGGFIRQQLVLLGAAPAAGKTAMAQWIFEGMAKRGISCVYLNLEMSRDQILARSFSRITAKNGMRIRSTDILQGYKWTHEQRYAIMAAAEEYRKEIAPNMIYNPDEVTPVLGSILSYIETEARAAEREGKPAPFVVLDYLQIIGSEDPREDTAAIIKRAMSSLKDYAIKHNSVVFVIMANNREANKSGDVTMESGRDTSALEYGADLQLGLAYTACLKRNGKKGKSREELTDEERKLVTLKVTKARFANPNTEVDLLFNGETMTYTQRVRDSDPFYEVDEITPFDRPRKRV